MPKGILPPLLFIEKNTMRITHLIYREMMLRKWNALLMFAAIAVAISLALIVWLYLLPRGQWLLALSLGLILGGAVGNLWDRLAVGYVVDFISVHYADWYFPAFNVADSAITVGAGCMLLDSFLSRDDSNN